MNKTASAIGITGLGFLILWSGITNAGVLSTAQSLFMGHAPVPGTPQAKIFGGDNVSLTGFTTGGTAGSPVGAIAGAAMQHINTPYVWGGHDPSGWDCYGMLTYVLHNDLGYNLPNNTHSGYLEFLAWSGASVIPASQIQAGDLIIWPTHAGIAVSATEMISAENPSKGTRVDTFANGGPLLPEPMTVLRVKQPLLVA
jgi:cell wall-associated NlpC family hydrolase